MSQKDRKQTTKKARQLSFVPFVPAFTDNDMIPKILMGDKAEGKFVA